ncbi:MAG: mitochondrial fission ELM1 family protein [Proteobacteria bacterium]|nr:mitochondrial fission ELM1 family protein [Pseudomonadota bacterium]
MAESSDSVDRAGESRPPRIWLVVGEKPGDNAQILNLAEATGWDFEAKKIFVKSQWVTGKPRVRPTLDHIDLCRSDSLEAPWPDLVMTAGRRLSCVGLFIKKASAGRTRLVMIGKPRRMLDSVDLIVLAAQYALPPAPNVTYHELPLMQVDPVLLESARKLWESRMAQMPRPLTALMIGGPTGGLLFDLATAEDLLDKTLETVRESGGSLYVTTSRRTPPEVTRMLERRCPPSAKLFRFVPDATPNENPYHGLLASADRFVVTTDSASMMVEVARLGRSLAIYPLEAQINFLERSLEALGVLRPLSPRSEPHPAGGFRARSLYRLGRPVHSRDLSAIPRLLVEKGLASWLGDEWVHSAPFVDQELDRVAKRIRALIKTPRES